MFKRAVAVAAMVCAVASPVWAGPAGDITRTALYAGTLDEGRTALAPLAEAGDAEAQFGLGFIGFVDALGGLSRAFYRHGGTAPDGGPMLARLIGGDAGGPAGQPANPNPEPLDYAGFRQIVETLIQQLDASGATLRQAAATGDFVLPIDLAQLRLDLDGDGTAGPDEAIGGLIGLALQDATAPGDLDVPVEVTIGFDRADAVWLAGYSTIVAAQADFLLAHDFSEFFNAVFHRFFPKAGLPMAGFAGQGGQMVMDPESDRGIADAIAAVHTLNWPVADAERLAGVRERLKRVLALSRQNWDLILAETDDDRELVPNPRQTGIVPEARVSEAMVAAWRETLDTADAILDGTLLIPHWRFQQGFDLKAYFETATRTDLVMILTGHGALPFLRDGPIADASSFDAANRVFGDNLLGYAFWFN
jgi:hypothetical protein